MKKMTVNTSLLILFLSTTVLGCSNQTEQKTFVENEVRLSTFARFVPERKDDFAWENDLVAFRAYGPAARSGAENAGVDCWLKRVKYPIINKWYKQHLEEDKSYHFDHGEGLDNYHVGSSAGCGGTSLWVNNKREPLEAWTKWEVINTSPNKTSFKLFYQREVNGKVYQEEKTISIELGKRFYTVQSQFFINGNVAAGLPVTVGVTTHDGKAVPYQNEKKGWIATWEVNDGYGLGTAVMVAPERIKNFKIINSNGVKDIGHALILLETDAQGMLEYQAGYGWQKANEINNVEQWQNYLNANAL